MRMNWLYQITDDRPDGAPVRFATSKKKADAEATKLRRTVTGANPVICRHAMDLEDDVALLALAANGGLAGWLEKLGGRVEVL